MTLTENEIDDRTAFAQGDEFANEAEVREYFTVESMLDMFGRDPDYAPPSQHELDAWADAVIANRWHMEPLPTVAVEFASDSETICHCANIDEFAGLGHPFQSEATEAYRRVAINSLRDDPRANRLDDCPPKGQRCLHSQWRGAHWGYHSGAIGTMAADLTDAEKAAISAADKAGREAARIVIAEADAPTREQIAALQAEAAAAGDDAMVAICAAALDGDPVALAAAAQCISDAAAQQDE